MTRETEQALRTTPLAAISSGLLAEYTNSAHDWDEQISVEMRYFLPRYLELIALDDVPCRNGLAICLSRLHLARWREMWPAEESGLLLRYLDALLRQHLLRTETVKMRNGERLRAKIADVLALSVTAGGDLPRLLGVWDAAADPPAVLHMADARAWGVTFDADGPRLATVWLEGGGEPPYQTGAEKRTAAQAIGAFLMRPEVKTRGEAAFFVVDNLAHQAILSNIC